MASVAYVDESIHDNGDFIVVAMVFAPDDISHAVEDALRNNGFTPGVDEFKSSMTMNGNPAAQSLRAAFQHLVMNCSLAVVVCPRAERKCIVEYCSILLREISLRESIYERGRIYFDEGMKRQGLALPGDWDAELNCNSKTVVGVQLADCAAYTTAVLILAEPGLNTKTVPPGNYPSDEPIELAWSLWTSLRYASVGSEPAGPVDEDGIYFEVKRFGLYVSDACSDAVKAAVAKRLSTVSMCCIY